MKKLLLKLIRSEDCFDDLYTLVTSGLISGGKILISRKVWRKIDGTLGVNGSFRFGFITNRVGLDPSASGVLRIYRSGKLQINGSVRVARSCKMFIAGNCTIGNRTYINPGTMIFARTSVQIGEGCAISWNCEIIDDDFHVLETTGETSKPIVIENNVWIGSHCSILKGVTIGQGSVIGSRSVVTRNIPPGCLAVGSPAKVVRSDVSWK